MNLKDKADSILSGHVSSEDGIIELYTDSRVDALAAMIEFAKLACEEQKKLCAISANLLIGDECDEGAYVIATEVADVAKHYGDSTQIEINYASILNAPTVKFD